MPHVIVELCLGNPNSRRRDLSEAIVKDVVKVLNRLP